MTLVHHSLCMRHTRSRQNLGSLQGTDVGGHSYEKEIRGGWTPLFQGFHNFLNSSFSTPKTDYQANRLGIPSYYSALIDPPELTRRICDEKLTSLFQSCAFFSSFLLSLSDHLLSMLQHKMCSSMERKLGRVYSNQQLLSPVSAFPVPQFPSTAFVPSINSTENCFRSSFPWKQSRE